MLWLFMHFCIYLNLETVDSESDNEPDSDTDSNNERRDICDDDVEDDGASCSVTGGIFKYLLYLYV